VRLVRVLRMFSELVVLVQTIGASMMAVAWMTLLLFLVIYTGSIVTVLLIGQPNKGLDPDVDKFFGNLGNALFSHFCVVTLENWPEIAGTAMRQSQLWSVYFVGVIVFTNFALVNLMVGVIVQRIIFLKGEQENELASFAAESEQFRMTLRTLFDSMELNFDNEVSTKDIRALLERKETHEIMSAFGINLFIPHSALHTVMDVAHEGTTTFEQFFDSCIRLCGSQHNLHSIFVQHDVCKCRHDLSRRMEKVEELARCLSEGDAPRNSPAAGMEAELHDLLGRMDTLGRAQEQMLADLAALKQRACEGAGEQNLSWSNHSGGSWSDAPYSGDAARRSRQRRKSKGQVGAAAVVRAGEDFSGRGEAKQKRSHADLSGSARNRAVLDQDAAGSSNSPTSSWTHADFPGNSRSGSVLPEAKFIRACAEVPGSVWPTAAFARDGGGSFGRSPWDGSAEGPRAAAAAAVARRARTPGAHRAESGNCVKQVLQKSGQEIGTCCIADPLSDLPPASDPSSRFRDSPAERRSAWSGAVPGLR